MSIDLSSLWGAARRALDRLAGREDREIREVLATGIFDAEYYRERYPDVRESGLRPEVHYVRHGAREGRMASSFFDGNYYLRHNRDVARGGFNPLLHFSTHGWRESRHPSRLFDVSWYAATHLGAQTGHVNPLVHYLTIGRGLGLDIHGVIDPRAELIRESGLFDEQFYRSTYADLSGFEGDLLEHYLQHGGRERRSPCADFDAAYYVKNNPDVARSKANPLLHFCMFGWRELRNPSRNFDVWWYWSQHLDARSELVNPLGHYVRHGRQAGLSPRPPRFPARIEPAPSPAAPASWRRVCLFAGYDVHGVVDDYVVAYLRDLSRFADVYYLADCEMSPEELAKLDGIVVQAWTERHGEYDFGSYSRLAQLVGWERLAGYDEMLLVNDSCYLLKPLDDVFSEMADRDCDWWGMQATKGLVSTRNKASNRFRRPIPIDQVHGGMLDSFENEYCYDFHLGSYFIAFRRAVVADPRFQRFLSDVTGQQSKRHLVLKYEIGLTRFLTAWGYTFDTYVRHLYPFHPVYTQWYFVLLNDGFPLLKRYLLSENHHRVPALWQWEERILAKIPQADIPTIKGNLHRVVDDDVLHRNLHVGGERLPEDLSIPERLLSSAQFVRADQSTPTYRHWWAFPVCAFSQVFSGNERAVFEEVRNDPSIKKIIFTHDQPVNVGGVNVEVVPLRSPRGQFLLMRCAIAFIKHSPARNLVYPLDPRIHHIVNLWHGIPFKRIGYASLDMQERLQAIGDQHAKCRAVISSSKIDTLAMSTSFYPLSYSEVWNTGLPRNDFIVKREELLPEDMLAQLEQIRELCGGRRLVLLMPTFRNGQEDAYYRFEARDLAFLREWLDRNDAVLGIREHMADKAHLYSEQLAGLNPLNLSDAHFPNVEMLYRASSALITDYSSCFIDYMLTGKPAVSFAYDHDAYLGLERGAFYDLDQVFPGVVCATFAELASALDRLFDPRGEVEEAEMAWKRRIFFDYLDDKNSARVVERSKQLVEVGV